MAYFICTFDDQCINVNYNLSDILTIFLNDLVEDDSERDLWLKLFQSLTLQALNERFWNLAELKMGLRRRGAMFDLSALSSGYICVSLHNMAGRLFVRVLKK